jgi:hypothetical protein
MEHLVGNGGKYYAKWGEKHSGSFWRVGLTDSTMPTQDLAFFQQGYRIASLDIIGDKFNAIWNNSLGTGVRCGIPV